MADSCETPTGRRRAVDAGLMLFLFAVALAAGLPAKGLDGLAVRPLVTPTQPDIEGFMWWLAPAEMRVPHNPIRTRRQAGHQSPTEPVRFSAARGESEAAQVVFSPGLGLRFEDVRLVADDLERRGGGGRIPAARLDWRLVQYVEMGDARDPRFLEQWQRVQAGSGLDAIPDILRPVEGFDTTVDEHRNYPMWLSVYVPYGTRPGQYSGTLTLKAGRKRLATRPIELTVWDFDIPEELHARTGLFSLGTDFANHYYGFTHQSPAAFRLTTDAWHLFLTHRLEPAAACQGVPLYDTSDPRYRDDPVAGLLSAGAQERFRACCEFWKARGRSVNNVNFLTQLSWDFSPEAQDGKRRFFEAYVKILRETGTLEGAYARQPDEYGSIADAAKAVQFAKELRAIAPDLKILTTAVQGRNAGEVEKAAVESSDVWCTYPNQFEGRPFFKQRIAAGEPVWWYIHYAIFYEFASGAPRSFFWSMRKYGISGCILWATGKFGDFVETPYSVRMRAFKARPGDGVLFWPDRTHGMIETARLELIRDGLEDYEYFWLLERATERLQALPADETREALVTRVREALTAPQRLIESPSSYRAGELSLDNLRASRDEMGALLGELGTADLLPNRDGH